jgi:16S rRNA (uracil1498-N3)-methyltransferase
VGHRPHVYLPSPWTGPTIDLHTSQHHHLRSVLRLTEGEIVTYTDGRGMTGRGQLAGDAVIRSHEGSSPPPRLHLTLAVAPPRDKDRTRFLVEKAAELEVSRLVWLETRLGQGHPPPTARAQAWAISGLEQSRGAFLLEVDGRMFRPNELSSQTWAGDVWIANATGGAIPSLMPASVTFLIGPEGGWSPDELPSRAAEFGLGRTILRVETAAITAAALLLRP